MPNPAKKTVKRLPLDSAAPEEVVVDLRMMTWSDVTAWHTIIQPIIDTGLLGVAPIRGVATALLDCAVISGISAGGNGETLLHADPRGGPKLQEFYRKKCGMKQVKMENGAISLVRRFNTDQYFYMDPATAIIFTSKLDHRR